MAGARAEDHPVRWAVVVLIALGCRAGSLGPYESPAEATRDTVRAQELTLEAADLIATDPEEAEERLREALTADLFHGPAHNNLGVLYLKEGKLYEAAGEFEWARKLLPGHPDPRVNLALTLEEAGQWQEARDSYATALEVYPRYLPAVQGLARITARAGQRDERQAGWLNQIALEGDEAWRSWARKELLRD